MGFVAPSAAGRHGRTITSSSKVAFAPPTMSSSSSSSSSRMMAHQLAAKKDEEEDGAVVSTLIDGNNENEQTEAEAAVDTLLEMSFTDNNETVEDDEPEDPELIHDKEMMHQAILMAASSGGERGSHGPFPRPICGAVLVAKDGRVRVFYSFCLLLCFVRLCVYCT